MLLVQEKTKSNFLSKKMKSPMKPISTDSLERSLRLEVKKVGEDGLQTGGLDESLEDNEPQIPSLSSADRCFFLHAAVEC